jgi:hypothetical protein
MKTLLLASAAVLALSAGIASAGAKHPGAITHAKAHHFITSPGARQVTLYDQNIADNGVGIVSDDFDSGTFDSYDSQIADDFAVPAGVRWKIRHVQVTGVYFNGSGPSDGQNIYFYKDEGGKPGKLKYSCGTVHGRDNGSGSFDIIIPKSCDASVKGFDAGKRFWVSVQARMNFTGGAGEWGWSTNNTQVGNPAMFRSAGGFGCTQWDTLANCIGSYGQGPDVAFALVGKIHPINP